MQNTPEAAVSFLNGLGSWTHYDDVYYEGFLKWKALVPELMRVAPRCWYDLAETHDPDLVEYATWIDCSFRFEWWRESSAIISVRPDSVLDAILVSVAIDHARGARFKWCAARDCALPFLVERKGQKYCSRECCHRSVVRKSRARARKRRGSSPRAGSQVTRQLRGRSSVRSEK